VRARVRTKRSARSTPAINPLVGGARVVGEGEEPWFTSTQPLDRRVAPSVDLGRQLGERESRA